MRARTQLLLVSVATFLLQGCSFDDFLDDFDSGPPVVYVQEPRRPMYYDPYYNAPKVYRQSTPYYTETVSKKKKDGQVTKTKTVRNEWGQTVYKEKTTKPEKKKRKKKD